MACGDVLVGADYQGEPLMVLEGQVLVVDSMPLPQGEVRVAVFWSSQGEHGHQHQQQTQISTTFPARYSLTLYTPPPDEVHYEPEHAGAALAIGVPILYDDVDMNGRFDTGEDVLGGSEDVLLLYAPERLEHQPPSEPEEDTDAPPDEPPGDPLEPGYHAVRLLEESCDAGRLVLTVVDPADVTMVVGELWDSLGDVDCDGELGEWEDR